MKILYLEQTPMSYYDVVDCDISNKLKEHINADIIHIRKWVQLARMQKKLFLKKLQSLAGSYNETLIIIDLSKFSFHQSLFLNMFKNDDDMHSLFKEIKTMFSKFKCIAILGKHDSYEYKTLSKYFDILAEDINSKTIKDTLSLLPASPTHRYRVLVSDETYVKLDISKAKDIKDIESRFLTNVIDKNIPIYLDYPTIAELELLSRFLVEKDIKIPTAFSIRPSSNSKFTPQAVVEIFKNLNPAFIKFDVGSISDSYLSTINSPYNHDNFCELFLLINSELKNTHIHLSFTYGMPGDTPSTIHKWTQEILKKEIPYNSFETWHVSYKDISANKKIHGHDNTVLPLELFNFDVIDKDLKTSKNNKIEISKERIWAQPLWNEEVANRYSDFANNTKRSNNLNTFATHALHLIQYYFIKDQDVNKFNNTSVLQEIRDKENARVDEFRSTIVQYNKNNTVALIENFAKDVYVSSSE